jgi:hypothetical protein
MLKNQLLAVVAVETEDALAAAVDVDVLVETAEIVEEEIV